SEDRAVPLDLLAGRALGGERDHLGGGKPARRQQLEDRRADQAGRAEDTNSVAVATHLAHPLGPAQPATVGRCSGPVGSSGRTASSPSSKTLWRALTASGTRSAAMTHEILIGEVEIISMLIFSRPRTSKTLAATPGCERIPAPTIETLPI